MAASGFSLRRFILRLTAPGLGSLPWMLLAFTGIALEICGLWFQYGMGLPPCVNCVYERALYLTFIVAGITGMFCVLLPVLRLIAALILFTGSLGGIYVAYGHLLSYAWLAGGCPLRADFPGFLKLDEWFPSVFRARGSCGPLDWSFLGLNMPQWVLITFVCGALAAVILLMCGPVQKRLSGRGAMSEDSESHERQDSVNRV